MGGMFVFSRKFLFTDDKYNTNEEKYRQFNLLIKIFLFMILQNLVFIFNSVVKLDSLPDWFDNLNMIKKAYKYNYFRKMGNLPHKNIMINNFGNVEREDKFDFWKFYVSNIEKGELLKTLKERKQNKSHEGIMEDCCNC